jgi:hypothetical protein
VTPPVTLGPSLDNLKLHNYLIYLVGREDLNLRHPASQSTFGVDTGKHSRTQPHIGCQDYHVVTATARHGTAQRDNVLLTASSPLAASLTAY